MQVVLALSWVARAGTGAELLAEVQAIEAAWRDMDADAYEELMVEAKPVFGMSPSSMVQEIRDRSPQAQAMREARLGGDCRSLAWKTDEEGMGHVLTLCRNSLSTSRFVNRDGTWRYQGAGAVRASAQPLRPSSGPLPWHVLDGGVARSATSMRELRIREDTDCPPWSDEGPTIQVKGKRARLERTDDATRIQHETGCLVVEEAERTGACAPCAANAEARWQKHIELLRWTHPSLAGRLARHVGLDDSAASLGTGRTEVSGLRGPDGRLTAVAPDGWTLFDGLDLPSTHLFVGEWDAVDLTVGQRLEEGLWRVPLPAEVVADELVAWLEPQGRVRRRGDTVWFERRPFARIHDQGASMVAELAPPTATRSWSWRSSVPERPWSVNQLHGLELR